MVYDLHYALREYESTCMEALEVHMPAHTKWQGISAAWDPGMESWQGCSLSGTSNV